MRRHLNKHKHVIHLFARAQTRVRAGVYTQTGEVFIFGSGARGAQAAVAVLVPGVARAEGAALQRAGVARAADAAGLSCGVCVYVCVCICDMYGMCVGGGNFFCGCACNF
jgi:hypothetical protein